MGAAPDAIPQRLARGEPIDVLLMAAEGFDAMVSRGFGMAGSRVDICRSLIGMAVREGAAKPDISTVEKLRDALLAARSIGYSASASGVYIETEMFRRLGIHDQVMPKARRILSERVAAVVARGEVEIGFQQVSEIIFIPGASFVGTLPEAVQRATVFSAGFNARAQNIEGGRRLIAFLASAEAAPELTRTGLEPLLGRQAGAVSRERSQRFGTAALL
ncbi:MAG: substrate-binding domain-containing protein, partial [Acetobacteraceae bacterium]|nr:substrate-binding domain-containing protein [Acetobacteraceae bacterium]